METDKVIRLSVTNITTSTECTVPTPALPQFSTQMHNQNSQEELLAPPPHPPPAHTQHTHTHTQKKGAGNIHKQEHKHRCLLQVHGIGGTVGVIFYSLMASKNYTYELYGESYQKTLTCCVTVCLSSFSWSTPYYPTHLTLPPSTLGLLCCTLSLPCMHSCKHDMAASTVTATAIPVHWSTVTTHIVTDIVNTCYHKQCHIFT